MLVSFNFFLRNRFLSLFKDIQSQNLSEKQKSDLLSVSIDQSALNELRNSLTSPIVSPKKISKDKDKKPKGSSDRGVKVKRQASEPRAYSLEVNQLVQILFLFL